MYSLAQLEARPSLTKEAHNNNKISCDQQQSLKEDNQQDQQCQKKNNNKCADQQLQKVQKPTKSVRIVEPPKAVVVLANNKPRDNHIRRGCAPPAVSIPLNPLSSFISSAVNRPRSVTDALFAAAPEVVAQTQGPTPSAAAAVVAVAKDGRTGQQNLNHLPEDMNKGFLQFAEVDPELTSKYIVTGKELWTRREKDEEVFCNVPDGI